MGQGTAHALAARLHEPHVHIVPLMSPPLPKTYLKLKLVGPASMRSGRLALPLLLLGWCLPAGSLSLLARSRSFGRKRAPHPRASEAPPAAVDVAVIGGGPAAYTIAALLARDEHSVALIDPAPDGAWPNNYGSWRNEWEVRRLSHAPRPAPATTATTPPRTWMATRAQALAERLQMPELLECVAANWKVTDVFFGGSFDTPFDDKVRLDKAYLQASRTPLKRIPQPCPRARACPRPSSSRP